MTVFQTAYFVQDLLVFLMGILVGFITSSIICSPRWILDEFLK